MNSAKIEKLAAKRKSHKLASLATGKKKDIRIQAIGGLAKVGDDTSINTLIQLLHDPDREIQLEAIKNVGSMGNSVIKTHLQYFIEKSDDKELIAAAKKSISQISNQIPFIEELEYIEKE